jgi:Ca2+-binding RTX toxin-like protein
MPSTIKLNDVVRATDYVLSPDGQTIYMMQPEYVPSFEGTVRARPIGNDGDFGTWKLSDDPAGGAIDIAPDGSFLIVADRAAAQVYKIDLATNAITTFAYTPTGAEGLLSDVAILSNGTVLFSQNFEGSGYTGSKILDLTTGVFTEGPAIEQSSTLTRSEDGSLVFIAEANNSGGPVAIYQTGGGIVDQGGTGSYNWGVQAYSDSLIANYAYDQGVVILDANLDPVTVLSEYSGGRITGLVFSEDESWLYLLDNEDNAIIKMSTADWTVAATIPVTADLGNWTYWTGELGKLTAQTLDISADGRILTFLANDRGLPAIFAVSEPDAAPFIGTPGGDGLFGTVVDDTSYGFGGDDTVEGGSGDDRLFGGAGNDSLPGGVGNDYISGGTGDDHLTGSWGDDLLFGGEGNDYLEGGISPDGVGNDRLYGGPGDDTYWIRSHYDIDEVIEAADNGIDTVLTSAYRYVLPANVENLELLPRYIDSGDYALIASGNSIDNVITGNNGANEVQGLGGNDTIYGREHNDTLYGGAGNDLLYGESLADVLHGGHGEDRLFGGLGTDTLHGNADTDYLNGGNANDELFGGLGNDVLHGGEQQDTLDGQGGDDLLVGGPGIDLLTGGAGADRFLFNDGHMGSGTLVADRIADFRHADGDVIDLHHVDADIALDGDQAFAWIGNAAFSGTAGELRYNWSGNTTVITGDTDGDGTADFALWLTGQLPVTVGDFLL